MAQPAPVTPLFGTSAFPVTKSDTVRFPPSVIYVGGTGDVTICPADGNLTPVLFSALPAGSVVPCMAIGVMSAGTTATLMTRVS